jgi:hypothetical protein
VPEKTDAPPGRGAWARANRFGVVPAELRVLTPPHFKRTRIPEAGLTAGEAEYVGQTVGAPYAPQLGISSVYSSHSTSSAAQRQRSTASSGPTALPSSLVTVGG